MTYQNLGTTDVQASSVAQLGAILGPLIPYLVWLNRRNEEPVSASDAAAAANFGALMFVVFGAGTLVRWYLPIGGFLGAVAQLAAFVVAVALCVQGFLSVRRGIRARYPVSLPLIRN